MVLRLQSATMTVLALLRWLIIINIIIIFTPGHG